MTRSILVPVDGSEQADAAFDHAIDTHDDVELTVLYVLGPTQTGYFRDDAEIEEPRGADYEARIDKETAFLEGYVERGEEAGVPVSVETIVADERGHESREIIAFAEETGVDEIVMGSHGRTGVSRVLLGSVAERVVRRAPVPVTVVR